MRATTMNTIPDNDPAFWSALEAALALDDGAAALTHLAAGNPVYCCTDDTPEGVIEKHYPDGRRELVTFDHDGEHPVSRT